MESAAPESRSKVRGGEVSPGPVILRPGMEFAMDPFELGLVHVGVNLGGCDIRVTKELLDDTEIRPPRQEVGRETMP